MKARKRPGMRGSYARCAARCSDEKFVMSSALCAKLLMGLGKRDGGSCDQVARAIARMGARGYKFAAGR